MYDMQRTLPAAFAGLGALVLIVLSAAGCAPVENPPKPGATPTTSSTPSPSPSQIPTVQPAGCDTVLTQAGFEDLASGNLAPIEFEIQSWDYPLLQEMVTPGVICKWAGGGDVFVVVGQLPMDEQTWESTRTGLEADGYVLNDNYGVPGFIDGPDGSDESYPSRGFAWRNGILYYVSYPGILEFVPAFQT